MQVGRWIEDNGHGGRTMEEDKIEDFGEEQAEEDGNGR